MKRSGPLRRSTPDRRACSIEGCDSPARARGWCKKHYQRWKQSGDPEVVTVHANPVVFTCEACGREFQRFASQVRYRGAGRWCSNACRLSVQRRRPIQCQGCGQAFVPSVGPGRMDRRGKFCGRSCYASWLDAQPKRIRSYVCKVCGTAFTRPAAWGKAVTCSRACAGKAIQRPGSTHHRGVGWRRIAAAIRIRDRVCVRCQKVDVGRALSVDHIIPWVACSSESAANDERNLASLCSSCHGIKTTVVEPRLLRGDFLALIDFYGRDVAETAIEVAL